MRFNRVGVEVQIPGNHATAQVASGAHHINAFRDLSAGERLHVFSNMSQGEQQHVLRLSEEEQRELFRVPRVLEAQANVPPPSSEYSRHFSSNSGGRRRRDDGPHSPTQEQSSRRQRTH
ncbi:hypothetical protein CBS101457_002628 [Exobasidium rhododendri]|nr:hypothetical protein CBS101457_002628 [Exobasidium rhododendri]